VDLYFGWSGAKLTSIAADVFDIQDRLKHLHPLTKSERDEVDEDAEFGG
jgi:hypothetical protein